MKRFVSILLLLALLLGCLPVSVLADGGEGYFYLAASTQSGLVIAPERVYYTSEQTVGQALAASGHDFDGLESGIVSAIDGVSGNFVRGDENGDYDLDKQASSVKYYAFREDSEGALSADFQNLMKVMADYLYENADVQAYAKTAYDAAKAKFPGISDADAQTCANAITSAIQTYKEGQNTKHNVTFSQFTDAAYTIYAVSEYGKRINAENGALSLPNGAYTFYIYKDNKAVSGSLTVNGETQTISGLPEIPADAWINESKFQISQSSDLMSEQGFIDGELTLTHGTHTASATRPDTFDGSLYPYVELKSGVSGVTLSAIYKNASTGEEKTETLPFKSKSSPLYNVLARGAAGNTVTFRASQVSGNYTLLEDLTLTIGRTLTLSSLRVTNADGTPQVATESFSPEKTAYTYKVLDTEKTLNIYPTPSASGVTVTVNNQTLNESGCASVDVTSEKTISIVLTAGGYTSTYTLTVQTGAARRVIVTLGKNVESFVLRNKNGEVLTPASVKESTKKYTYSLVTGEEYSYYATSGYNHKAISFKLDESNSVLKDDITISLDKMPTLDTLQLSTSKDLTTGALELDKTFAPTTHEYTATVADTDSRIYAGAAASTGSYENTPVCTAAYNIISKQAADGTAKTVELTETGTQLSNVLLYQNANGNTVTFNVAHSTNEDATGSSTTYSTDYVVRIKRGLTLQSLEISGATLNENFSGATKAYTITVPAAQSKLSLTATAWGNNRYTETDGGYVLSANGEEIESGKAAEIKLSGNSKEESVKVTVASRDEQSDVVSYTITVKKAAGSKVTFNVETSGALLYIYEMDGGNRVWPDANGVCEISTGFTYCYSVTKSGYQGLSGAFQLVNDELVFGQIVKDKTDNYKPKFVADEDDKWPISGTIAFKLTAATASTLTKLDATWPDFRGDASNNGVISAKTPINAEDGTLYWAVKVGQGTNSKAVSAPILVDGYLYVYADDQILKIDKDTGEILKKGTMAGSSSFAINNPTYADGVILVGLSEGRIQAFNAETLESLWLYTDPLGGQPNCPITVHNGFAYTGFWNGEEKDGAFVCLSLTDEDTNSTTEAKAPSWRYVQKGGFYWAGAYVCDDFVMVGTDDGTGAKDSATANLLLLDPETGRLLDSKTDIVGDIRSSICYDAETQAYYFTTKGSYFYSVRVTNNQLTELRSIALGGMSTSTPVAANGRAYVGVSGTKQFDGDGYKLAVIDLNDWKVAYNVPTNGYPQTSGLLTTAYSDYNYVYFIENTQPGTLRLLRDQSGQTAADTTYQTKEGSGMSAYALFTPAGSQAQYCICSPIADENGTLYFKNDSGYLMAFGSAIKPDTLKVESQPTKLKYQAGDNFDKTGLKVTAQFTDGTTRDVTKLMEQEVSAALTEGTPDVTLKYAPGHIMYHNEQNDADKTMTAGVESTKPTVQIAITVGETSQKIGTIQWAYASNKLTLSGEFPTGSKLIAAAYDKTGKMTGTKVFTALVSAQITGAKIRLFLLDANGKPLCSSVTVTGA